MVREQKKSNAFLIAMIIVVVILSIVGIFLVLGGGKAGPKTDAEPEVGVLFKKRSSLPSRDVKSDTEPQMYTYTSYHLGLRFSYRNLYQIKYHQKSCPNNWPSCPSITKTVKLQSPVEQGNTIDFDGYHLEVFDKANADTLPTAIEKVIARNAPAGTCVTNDYQDTADKVEKATITYKAVAGLNDDDTCPARYRGNTNGRHFFMYPKYPFVFFFVEGPEGTAPLFSHEGTWIGTIQLETPTK